MSSSSSSSLARVRSHLTSDECFSKLYIDGKFVDAIDSGTFDTTYPATGEVLHSTIPRGRAKDVDAAVAAAEKAWNEGTWSGMTAEARAKIVCKMADAVENKVKMLAEIEAADVGKPVRQSSMVLGGCVGEVKYWCSLGKVLDDEQDVGATDNEKGEGGSPPSGFDVVYRRDPIGVVGLVSAWNYPLNVAFRKVAPALVAGNCAVLKPSEIACLSVMYLSRAAQEAGLPPGVLNVVTGDRDAGAALTSNENVKMISFTGSTATGSKIMEACAPKLSQCMLELGGKSAMVVFDDADLDKAVVTTMKGFLTNGGQICTAHTRLVLQETAKEKFLASLKEELEKIAFSKDPITEKDRGDRAWEDGTTDAIQPVVCESQRTKILDALTKAKSDGVEVLTGGGIPPASDADPKGYYVQPTVLVDVPRSHSMWQTEVFGPVLSVRTFSTEAEAIEEANSTKYGLASTVMSSDPSKAMRVANKIRAGAVYATSTGDGLLAEFPSVARGGFGISGVGRELGLQGLHEYTELKSVNYTGPGFTVREAKAAKRQRTE